MSISLTSLELELVYLILEFINDTSPRTIKSVALVNKYLNAATRIIAQRHKTLGWRNGDYPIVLVPTLVMKLDRWSANNDIIRGLRHLTVNKRRYPLGGGNRLGQSVEADDKIFHVALAKFLGQVKRLKRMTWSHKASLPLIVLDAFHKHHPTAKLEIFNFTRAKNVDHLDEVELALAKSSALTHLRTEIRNYRPGHIDNEDYRAPAFCYIVANAPNLEYAGIVVHDSSPITNYVISGQVQNSHEFDEALEHFHVKKRSSSVKSLTIDGPRIQLDKSSLETWAKMIDLTHLETLKFSRGLPTADYFSNAAKMLPNLKHVSLNMTSTLHFENAAANAYLCSSSSLTTLSIWGWTHVVSLEEIMKQHGTTLKSLQLHEKYLDDQIDKRIILSIEDIHAIRTRCPKLEDLTIDLNRATKKPSRGITSDNQKYYHEFSLFGPRLQKLQIYFDYGCKPGKTVVNADLPYDSDDSEAQDEFEEFYPYAVAERNAPNSDSDQRDQRVGMVLTASVEMMWKKIFGSLTCGARMLDVKFGEWDSNNASYSIPYFFTARPHERDDRLHDCIVKEVVRTRFP